MTSQLKREEAPRLAELLLELEEREAPTSQDDEASFQKFEARFASDGRATAAKDSRLRVLPGRRKLAVVAGLLAAAAAVALAFAFGRSSGFGAPRALDFVVVGGALADGNYVRQQNATATTLAFSEGTRIQLAAGTRSRLQEVSDKGASLVLESGRAELKVTHRPNARWSVSAGPFEVQVTGTRFSVEWNGLNESLTVDVDEGSVRIEGPESAEAIRVGAGEHYEADLGRDGRWSRHLGSLGTGRPKNEAGPAFDDAEGPYVGAADRQMSGGRQAADTASEPQSRAVESGTVRAREAANGEPSALPVASWRDLVGRGEALRVLSEVDSRGLEKVLARASSADLAALADAARYSGRPDVAERAFATLRQKHAGTREAASAAFLWGRLLEDRDRARAKALYEAADREEPRGPFSLELLGRRMQLAVKMGEGESARSLAVEYLRRAPTGPHAKRAQELVEKGR